MRRLATYGGRYPTCQATSNFPHRLCCCFSLSSSSSFLPLYSLPPLSLIISLICRGIRSIQTWILSCSSSCQPLATLSLHLYDSLVPLFWSFFPSYVANKAQSYSNLGYLHTKYTLHLVEIKDCLLIMMG